MIMNMIINNVNKAISSMMAIILLFLMITGCYSQPNYQNNNLSTEEVLNDNIVKTIIVNNEFNSWSVTSKSEYIIIDGILYGRGTNSLGIFGNKIGKFYDAWTKIAENVNHIEADDNLLLYLTYDGNLYGLGKSNNKVLCNKSAAIVYDNLTIEPILLCSKCNFFSHSNEFITVIKDDSTLWFWGESKNGQGATVTDIVTKPIKIAKNIQFVKSFGYTVAWIDFYGNLYLCGDNSFNQIGNGNKNTNVVSTPFCALKECNYFSVSNDIVINATTIDETEYIWGNYHKSTPTPKSKDLPLKTEATDFSKGITIQDNDNTLRKKDYPIIFYKDKDEKGNLSIISKSSNFDQNKSIVKTNLVPPFTMNLIGNSLTISSKNDNSLYLLTYNESSGGQINNIKMSLLYENYALPVYVKDSNHLVLALPQSYKELILDTHTGKTQEGEFWDYSEFDNKPNIKPSEAKDIALKELCKNKYVGLDKRENNFSNIKSILLVLQPSLRSSSLNSWITPEFFNNNDSINWCYHIKISNPKNELDIMEIFIDADTGDVYSIINSYTEIK